MAVVFSMLIDGQWRAGGDGAVFTCTGPFDGAAS